MPATLPTLSPGQNHDTFTGASFSLSNRLGRLVWGIVSLLVFRFSPRPLHAWRAWVLRCFGATVGRGVHVYPKARIWAPWNLTLGDECGIANDAIIYSMGHITVGRRAVISQGAHLVTGTHDYNEPGFPVVIRPIIIGDHAWVATEAFVHPGVRIGEGCVVGARAVVSKDMPEWMVCAGHPCIPIRPRKRI